MGTLQVVEGVWVPDSFTRKLLEALRRAEQWTYYEGREHLRTVHTDIEFADHVLVREIVPLDSGVGGGWGPYFALAVALEEVFGIGISDDEIERLGEGTFGQLRGWVKDRIANPARIVHGKAVPIA